MIVLVVILQITILIGNVLCFPSHKVVPEPFESSFKLPKIEVIHTEFEHLGPVISPNTIMHATDVNKLLTKFIARTRRHLGPVIDFSPNLDYVEQNGNRYGPFQYNLDKMAEIDFNITAKTVIMIAGFLSDDFVPWIDESLSKWLQVDDVNTIQVTWSAANKYVYSSAVAATPLIGRQITIFLYYLAKLNGASLDDPNFTKNIHFVGHSLGAHIGGFFGKDLDGKLGRITALDPAGPSFDEFSESYRLDKTDAMLVEVIHTNRGKMKYLSAAAYAPFKAVDALVSKIPYINQLSNSMRNEYSSEGGHVWFGIDMDIGHIDYYANDGRTQPGCSDTMHICDHGRAHEILISLLDHEIRLKYSTDKSKNKMRSRRLMAFKSMDYESFQSGTTFSVLCPQVMRLGEHLTERSSQTIHGCSIPLDLMTPIDDLLSELRSKYNIDLARTEENNQRNRYFFKTNPYQDFLGDHHLFKLYLDSKTQWDENVCRLEIDLELGGQLIRLELTRLLDMRGFNPLVVAIPFVYQNSYTGRKLITEFLFRDEQVSKDLLHSYKRKILPERVTVSITRSGTNRVIDSIKNQITKIIRGSSSSNDCRLNIGMVEVHPIVPFKRNVAGIYGVKNSTQKEILVYSPEDMFKIPWVEDEISKLSIRSLKSITRELTAFVVN